MIDGLREDLTVIIVAHVEENYDAEGSLRVSFMVPGGKLLKEKIKIDGMFTTVLYTEVEIKDRNQAILLKIMEIVEIPEGMFKISNPNDKTRIGSHQRI